MNREPKVERRKRLVRGAGQAKALARIWVSGKSPEKSGKSEERLGSSVVVVVDGLR